MYESFAELLAFISVFNSLGALVVLSGLDTGLSTQHVLVISTVLGSASSIVLSAGFFLVNRLIFWLSKQYKRRKESGQSVTTVTRQAVTQSLNAFITFDGSVASLCSLAYIQGLFTNSFIINEESVVLFVLASIWLAKLVQKRSSFIKSKQVEEHVASGSGSSNRDRASESKSRNAASIKNANANAKPTAHSLFLLTELRAYEFSLLFVAGPCLRLMGSGEQFSPVVQFSDMTLLERVGLLVSVPTLVWLVTSTIRGQLAAAQSASPAATPKGRSSVKVIANLLLPIAAVLMLIFWVTLNSPATPASSSSSSSTNASSSTSSSAQGSDWILTILVPRIIYALSILSCISLLIWKPQRRYLNAIASDQQTGVTVSNMARLSAHWVTLLASITTPAVLVLGARAPYVVLLFTIVLTSMLVTGELRDRRTVNTHKDATVTRSSLSTTELTFLFFLAIRFFFATAHRYDFASLPVTAGFIGFEQFNFYISGLLLGLNTWGGHLMIVFALPVFIAFRSENITEFHQGLSKAVTFFLLLFAGRTLLSAVNVTIQRRHLMVWAIFAPKYIFDAVAHLVVNALLLVVLMCSSRIAWSAST